MVTVSLTTLAARALSENIKMQEEAESLKMVDGDSVTETWYNRNANWINGIAIFLGVQAILGLIALEYAWCRLKRIREVDEDRDSQFPAFRRVDVKNWSKLKFYPGAMLTMPSRLAFLILHGIIHVTFMK